MRTCETCLLNDNMPSVRISEEGVCNYCAATQDLSTAVHASCTAVHVDQEFVAMLKEHADRRYQVLMAYSGGKDSTYTLKLLREKYGASILAVTFNNGFLSEDAIRNINQVTDRLGVDSMIVKYPAPKLLRGFRFIEDGKALPRTSLERASSICNLCIMLVKNRIYQEAILRDIPIICFGWTPGQVQSAKPLIRLDHRMVTKGFGGVRNAICNTLGSDWGSYFLDTEFMQRHADSMPFLYYPFVSNGYDERSILLEISEIGWKQPENTDGNSSNCLLNSYANQSHLERFGYHPYAFEVSSMVREGYMTREEGLEKLEKVKHDTTFEKISGLFSKTGSDT